MYTAGLTDHTHSKELVEWTASPKPELHTLNPQSLHPEALKAETPKPEPLNKKRNLQPEPKMQKLQKP